MAKTMTEYCGGCGFTPSLDAASPDDQVLIRVATEAGADERCGACALKVVAQNSRLGDITALVAIR